MSRHKRKSGSALESNALALMLSSVATGVLGLAYWAAAERFFPTEEVGRAAAVINSAIMLAALSCLSLGGAYQRFLPVAGRLSARLICAGIGVVSVAGLILGLGFAFFGPSVDRLFHSTTERVAFPLLVSALAVYALSDPILTGLRMAWGVAAKNIALSVLKIVAVLVVAGSGGAIVLVGSWGLLAIAVTLVAVGDALRRTIVHRRDVAPELPPVRELWAFQGVFFAMSVVLILTPLTLPLIVVTTMGAADNAYFNLAWTMCSALGLLRGAVGSAFIVEASRSGSDRPQLLRRLIRMMSAVTVVSAVGLAVCGPIVLAVVGADYVEAAWQLVVVMAVDTVVGSVVVVYFLLAQIVRRLRLMFAVQCLIVMITIAGAFVLVPKIGLTGIGVAVLTANTVGLLILLRPLRRVAIEFTTAPAEPGPDDVLTDAEVRFMDAETQLIPVIPAAAATAPMDAPTRPFQVVSRR
ncbi:polysaccharide biosynthesis protein [Williamsia sp.]|uniref:lipopolysaccharide biosynthesis protein n=1 Tax=Williamsia sp. TaxID=1872085 RepID=UPI002F94C439